MLDQQQMSTEPGSEQILEATALLEQMLLPAEDDLHDRVGLVHDPGLYTHHGLDCCTAVHTRSNSFAVCDSGPGLGHFVLLQLRSIVELQKRGVEVTGVEGALIEEYSQDCRKRRGSCRWMVE